MFELTISINSEKQKITNEIYDSLYKEVKSDNGVLIKHNSNGRSYVALAVDDKKKNYYKTWIRDYIIYMILNEYKYEFYYNKMGMLSSSVMVEPYLRCLTLMDQVYDHNFIKKELKVSGEVLIDSFYHFKLKPLRDKWDKTTDMYIKNNLMKDEETLIDLIRFVCVAGGSGYQSSEVSISKNQLKLAFDKDPTSTYKRDKKGEAAFFSEIVKFCPAKINVKFGQGIDETDEVYNYLRSIFPDLVYLV